MSYDGYCLVKEKPYQITAEQSDDYPELTLNKCSVCGQILMNNPDHIQTSDESIIERLTKTRKDK